MGQREQDIRQRKNQITQNELEESPLLDDNQEKMKLKYKQSQFDSSGDWIDSLVDGIVRYDMKTTLTAVTLTFISLMTRMYNISRANFVVWDEAHFGKFGSHYLKREFYFDVHPPLGKMLVGLSGLLSGYKGDFGFESGKVYPEGLNYTGMRVFLAMFGVMMVPLAYLTCIELKLSQKTAILAAIMVICDNAFLSISRYILLDSMLLFFTVSTFYCLSVFHNVKSKSFTAEWWLWLFLTGCSIGAVSSVKWVGFFVTATVGLYTIEDLWDLFGDFKMPKLTYIKHFGVRALCLIMVPILVYMASFWVHFKILAYSGPGDAQMSSLFQANLIGNKLHESPLYAAFGSRVTIKNNGYGGGLLHSHVQTFPHGSKQQQVTCYHHKDSNNDWIITKVREAKPVQTDIDSTQIEYLKNGDVIRLVHNQTSRNLHSHAVAAPISKWANEVSAYGNDTVGDSNDYWIVEVVDDLSGTTDYSKVRSLTTRFRLRHQNLKCLLRSHNVNLPEWGFKQAEVVCDKYNKSDLYNIWNIEQHWNYKMEPGTKSSYKTSFIKDFIHLNVGMMTSNNALTPDPDKEPDGLTSSPVDWPMQAVGLRMCGWGDDQHKVLLLGNPVIWWGGFASLVGFCLVWFFFILRWKRGFNDWNLIEWDNFTMVGKYILVGWVLHFVPFMIMARVTYLHHYFPALYFAILMFAFMTEHLASYFKNAMSWIVWGIVYTAVIITFVYFAPLSYGFDGPSSAYKNRMWRSGWKVTN